MDMSDDLDKLAEIGVPKLHIEILRWFRKSGKPFGSVVNDNAILNGKRVRPGKNGKMFHHTVEYQSLITNTN